METLNISAGTPFSKTISLSSLGLTSPTVKFEVRSSQRGELVISGTGASDKVTLTAAQTKDLAGRVLYGVVFANDSTKGPFQVTDFKLVVNGSFDSEPELDLGSTLPKLSVSLIRNSNQNLGMRWTPPEGGELDFSDTVFTLEFDKYPIVLTAVTTEGVDDTWTSTWTITNEQAVFPFTTAYGKLVSTVAGEPTTVMRVKYEVTG